MIFGKSRDPEYGVLRYNPQTGLSLRVKMPRSLRGISKAHPFASPYALGVPDTVIGADENGSPVSLFGCHKPGTESKGGLFTTSVRPMAALLGHEFKTWNATYFRYACVTFNLLHNWTGRSRIVLEDVENPKQIETRVCVEKPEPISIKVNGALTLVLFPTVSISRGSRGVRCKESHCLEFTFTSEQRVADLMLDVSTVRRLLTLFTGRPVFYESVKFTIKPRSSPLLELLKTNEGVTAAQRSLIHQNMLVSLPDVQDCLPDVIRRWFILQPQLKDVLNLYFSTIFSPSLYTNHQFLFLAQAIEVYHRTNPKFEHWVQPKLQFRERKKRIIEAIPNEAAWLKEKLAFANEKTYAERLREVSLEHEGVIGSFIPDLHRFVRVVKTTRNHFTHYSTPDDRMEDVAKGVGLMELTDKLRTLLEVCIFSDIGISGVPIERLIVTLRRREYFSL